MDQRLGHLFRCGQTGVGEKAAVRRFWIVGVNDLLGKISTVAKEQVEMALVYARI